MLFYGIAVTLGAAQTTDVSFVAAHDQTEQRYVIVLPDGFIPDQPQDLLITLHGHGSDRWQFIRENRDEARAARDIAMQNKMILVSPDYRAKSSWMGHAAEKDLVQIINDLKKKFTIRNLVMSGGSMGATSALTFTVLHPDLVNGIVALNGHANHIEYNGFQDAIQSSFGGTKKSIPNEYKRRSAEFYPEKLAMPVAITAGGQDNIVPPNSVLRLGRVIKARNPLVFIDFKDTRGHETDYESSIAAYNFVIQALSMKPVPFSIIINGSSILPTHGSAAGTWFYADGDNGSQLLLAGHTSVPGSWQLTVSLNKGDNVRISLAPDMPLPSKIQFLSETLSTTAVECQVESSAIVIKAVSGPGAAKLTRFTSQNVPMSFLPERRPFSRAPVTCSPDTHPAITDSMVEWDWRMQDGIQTPREPRSYCQAIKKVVAQVEGLVLERTAKNKLSQSDHDIWTKLRATCQDILKSDNTEKDEIYWLKLHQFRRKIVFSNPLFKLPPLVMVKHVPSVMSHQLTQVYGACARPGGGLFIMEEPGISMRTKNITPPSLPAGNFMTPELSYDTKKMLFAYCPVKESVSSRNQTRDFSQWTEQVVYHIYELDMDSGTVRKLTRGSTDNFFPVYLPSRDILFISTMRGGFHRCGRGPCPVYTLTRMNKDGDKPCSISFHETHEWDPCLLTDGRVIYTRWDYVDRNAVLYQQLWSARPDGSNTRIYYGNNTWNPAGIWEARPIPDSFCVMATASPHHGMSAGSIVMLDTTKGVDGKEPLTRLTPDVRFPESESPLAAGPDFTPYDFDTPVVRYWNSPMKEPWMEKTPTEEENRWPGHCYKSPWPLSEKFFIVSYSFDQLVGEPGPNIPNMFGIYFADVFGNKELIYRDPNISSLWARPLAGRTPPPEIAMQRADTGRKSGTFFLNDVKESWPYLPTNNPITHLRIVQVLMKTTPHSNTPRMGAANASPGKQVLGTVPVEDDGSAYFEAPAQTPLLFQALDSKGRAVQTMRSLVYLQPDEKESCIGCHEHRMKQKSPRTQAKALQRLPSKIAPGPDGSLPFCYPRLVQPILNRHCLNCHDGKKTGRPILTADPENSFSKSYNSLVDRVSFSAWGRPQNNFEPLTEPGRFGALGSQLAKMLEKGHKNVQLTNEEWTSLYTWMDVNALFYGTFDVAEQKRQLAGKMIDPPKE